jgi:ATP phosphoribosyltransferase
MSAVKVALPKGRLMAETSALLERADWGLSDYSEGTRSYRLKSQKFADLQAKIFNEKDIPIQVAVGNYDLGICGLDWVEELAAKYPSSALVKLRELGFGEGAVYAVAAGNGDAPAIQAIQSLERTVRLVSEYPNLAEAFALKLRLKKFSVFPLWGAAEVYPPESADLALMPAKVADAPFNHGLTAISTVIRFSACLVANRQRWQDKDMSEVLDSLERAIVEKQEAAPPSSLTLGSGQARPSPLPSEKDKLEGEGAGRAAQDPNTLRLALPDGHQQAPAVALLAKAGIKIQDYPSSTGNRRPTPEGIPGLDVKVIRPQDMPMQVAAGNFDLAVTGRDWLRDHLYQFPSSPVKELVDLKFAKVRIVAVVCNDVPVSDGFELRELWASRPEPIRIAAEYANIADKYARDNHLGRYRVIPTWGATEAFLPEDADLLIENTETGRTIARHNLKIIDTLFESTGLLVGNPSTIEGNPEKSRTAAFITDTLRKAVEG